MNNNKKTSQKDIKPFTTMLVFPPQWTPQNPHFAITSLTGHLRKHGYRVLQRDLNVEFYDHVLTPEFLRKALEKVKLDYAFLSTEIPLKSLIQEDTFDFYLDALRYEDIDQFFKNYGSLADKLPDLIMDAKETLRDPRRFYNPMLLLDAFFAIDRALDIVSLPYHPAKICFNSFEHPLCLNVTASLITYAKDTKDNMYYEFYQQAIPEILAEKPDLIGVSINSFSQVLPGLTLALMLKKAIPDGTTLNIGGNFFGRVKDALLKRPEFFEHFCHCLSIGEGEKQNLQLIEALKGDKDLSKVPNILYFDKNENQVKYTYEEAPEKLDNLAFQELEGLPLDLYFSPDRVLCLQTGKGCYWGKCTFCDTDFGKKREVRSLEHLIDEIKYLKEKYNVRHFEFIDESIDPDYMRKMADRFIEEKLDIRWFCNGRLEEGFTKELMEHLYKSGLTMVLWGFESGSERIMKLINKGVDLKKRYEILKNSKEAGIWNFAYIFFGFPTETAEEAEETINAVINNRDIIHSYGRSVFTLGKHSLLFEEADKYGIFDIVEDSEELSTNLSYKSKGGLSLKEVDDIMTQCTKRCAEAYAYSLWYYLRYRENIHLYVAKYDRDYVDQYKVRQALSLRLQTW